MPGNRLYIGNLYCMVSQHQLRDLFEKYGTVRSISMVPGTGYAYIKMKNAVEAETARRALDGSDYLERVLRVKDAAPVTRYSDKEVDRLLK
ncbi:MAG: RNA-binding protein [Candidatus Aminicenantes bacterium]|nr:RNA-binding protein [Candidatus Aminicenantes bacterium]